MAAGPGSLLWSSYCEIPEADSIFIKYHNATCRATMKRDAELLHRSLSRHAELTFK
ncbi:hypothetical protein LEP1GSC041_1570 [Leptospira noguchii str. 2006001870]|nr:hypothetical protein LEP1GSC041_1570 [Leptospira noguchii str. 2006001870]